MRTRLLARGSEEGSWSPAKAFFFDFFLESFAGGVVDGGGAGRRTRKRTGSEPTEENEEYFGDQ